METLTVSNREEWRAWLSENYDLKSEIWLVYFKKESGMPGLAYEESVEEAICFGWVDSLIKKIDESRYARKFTPRKDVSQWSEPNKRRVERMIEAGLMTEHGLKLVEIAKEKGRWDEIVKPPRLDYDPHPDFESALSENQAAMNNFIELAPTHRKQYTGWINQAIRPETRRKRINEAIERLTRGEKLGLK
jgi:uncharacterized protein YdeI (YjbR/CyaY-like superfamily)